jgi:hypothetical protein
MKCARWKSRSATAKGCVAVQISNVVFGFSVSGRLWKMGF